MTETTGLAPHIGHARLEDELSTMPLPPVLLLTGPEGIGKRHLAECVLAAREIGGYDVLRLSSLSADDARQAREFAATGPSQGPFKAAILDLDGIRNVTAQAHQILLKTLEELPSQVRFIIIASGPVPPTIASRAVARSLGALSNGEVEQVLLQQGVPGLQAAAAARASAGRVSVALRQLAVPGACRERMLAALKAAWQGKPSALRGPFREWGVQEHELLVRWVLEAAVPSWRQFSVDDMPGMTTSWARTLLQWLSRREGGNPRVTDRAVLESMADLAAG